MTSTDSKGRDERVAVVFVHGQGQQRPMEDVQELARTMWDAIPGLRRKHLPTDPDDAPPGHPQPDEATTRRYARSFTVPDARLEGADFARVTTETGCYTKRIDFFEFYWADLMEGNRFDHLFGWFMQLLRRPRLEVPRSILPIRQLVIRFCESILLLALLYAFCVALLLPPPGPTRWDGMQKFALTDSGVLHPANHGWVAGLLALVMIFAAWGRMLLNESVGGAAPVGGLPTLMARLNTFLLKTFRKNAAGAAGPVLNVRAATFVGAMRARAALVIGVIGFVLLVFLVIWQGPSLQWGDLRVAIYVLVATSAAIVTFRRKAIIAAMTLAFVAAALGLIGALFGGIDGQNLFAFDTGSTFDNFANVWGLIPGSGDEPFANFHGTGAKLLILSLQSLQLFAGIWFAAAFFKQASAQSNPFVRITAVFVAVALSIVIAHLALSNEWLNPPFIWLVFSLGAQLLAVVVAVALLFAVAGKAFLLPVMADSARYLSRDPENVGARQKIRKRGLDLLDKLHRKNSGEAYNRIIIVAHSLGSVVAYELLMDFWSRQAGAYKLTAPGVTNVTGDASDRMTAALKAAGALAKACDPKQKNQNLGEVREAREAYRKAQVELNIALAQCEPDPAKSPSAAKWRITDFITVGSPLAHASLLLADEKDDFNQKKVGRTLCTCPPTPGDGDNGYTFEGADNSVRPMHSALFCVVRWTNIHFKAEPFILEGDVIGGPIGPMLGFGIEDVEVDRKDTGAVFAHNEYWRSVLTTDELRQAYDDRRTVPEHLQALKKALDLADGDETLRSLVQPPFRP